MMFFYERKWDILFSKFREAVEEQKKKQGIPSRFLKESSDIEYLALIYPEEKKSLELVPSLGPVFCDTYGDSFVSFMKNYKEKNFSGMKMRYNYFTYNDLIGIKKRLENAFSDVSALRLSYPAKRTCSSTLYGYLNDKLKEVSSVVFFKFTQVEEFLIEKGFLVRKDNNELIIKNKDYLVPFNCVENKPEGNPSYLITEKGLQVIGINIFDYYKKLFACSPFSEARRFASINLNQDLKGFANLVWCNKSYFLCQNNGECFRVDGGENKERKDEELQWNKLFLLDSRIKISDDNVNFVKEHEYLQNNSKFSKYLFSTNRKINLNYLAKNVLIGSIEVYPIPRLKEGDNVFFIFIPKKSCPNKLVLPYVMEWNIFLEQSTVENGNIIIPYNPKDGISGYSSEEIDWKFYEFSSSAGFWYAILGESIRPEKQGSSSVPWIELIELFDKHRDISNYLFLHKEDIERYEWSFSNPNYENSLSRIGYWYTYTCKYAYEYTKVYLEVLKILRHEIENKKMRILSVGCGQNVDYIGLRHALYLTKSSDSVIVYQGIDKQDWDDKLPDGIGSLKLPFLPADRDAGSLLKVGDCGKIESFILDLNQKDDKLDFDVIIFPTSYLDIIQAYNYDDEKIRKLWDSIRNLVNKKVLIIITTIYTEKTSATIDEQISKLPNYLEPRQVDSIKDDLRLSIFESAYNLYCQGLSDNIDFLIKQANKYDKDKPNGIHKRPSLERSEAIRFKSFIFNLNSSEENV